MQKNWARHSKKINPLLVHSASSVLGAVVVVKQRSTRECWLRKYMGVWKWMSTTIASSGGEFPKRLSK